MLNCKITEALFYDEERGGTIPMYGLNFFHIGSSDKSVRVVDALFRKEQEAMAVMARINGDGLSEIHIDDVIEDIIIETREYAPAD